VGCSHSYQRKQQAITACEIEDLGFEYHYDGLYALERSLMCQGGTDAHHWPSKRPLSQDIRQVEVERSNELPSNRSWVSPLKVLIGLHPEVKSH
jgi:hypothetical protein